MADFASIKSSTITGKQAAKYACDRLTGGASIRRQVGASRDSYYQYFEQGLEEVIWWGYQPVYASSASEQYAHSDEARPDENDNTRSTRPVTIRTHSLRENPYAYQPGVPGNPGASTSEAAAWEEDNGESEPESDDIRTKTDSVWNENSADEDNSGMNEDSDDEREEG